MTMIVPDVTDYLSALAGFDAPPPVRVKATDADIIAREPVSPELNELASDVSGISEAAADEAELVALAPQPAEPAQAEPEAASNQVTVSVTEAEVRIPAEVATEVELAASQPAEPAHAESEAAPIVVSGYVTEAEASIPAESAAEAELAALQPAEPVQAEAESLSIATPGNADMSEIPDMSAFLDELSTKDDAESQAEPEAVPTEASGNADVAEVPDMSSFLDALPAKGDAQSQAEPEAVPTEASGNADVSEVPDMSSFLDALPVRSDVQSQAAPAAVPTVTNGNDELIAPSSALGGSFVLPEEQRNQKHGRRAQAEARLGFNVGNLHFLVAFDSASELSEMVPVFALPNTAAWFQGLANLHGNLVPVFDLARLLATGRDPKAVSMLLVLGQREAAAAIVVDGLPRRLRLDSAAKVDLPALPEAIRDYIRGAYLHENEIWLEFDHGRFFPATAARLSD